MSSPSINFDNAMAHTSAVETDTLLARILCIVWDEMVEMKNYSYLRGWIAGYKITTETDSDIWTELEFLFDVAGCFR